MSRSVEHPRFRLNPGSYTDDTQMSIAITEVIVFVTAFKRDEREGYARIFYHFFSEKFKMGKSF
ncbi:ADP-ribosylglycohydrolase family protein [Nostoc sp.]|uniref:ADP-ribosylglycohydrolase family protein n=1 Tax=Nostoc sp. TaxID=1180 RepID=UPI002FFA593C